MRGIIVGLVALLAFAGLLFVSPDILSQSPQREPAQRPPSGFPPPPILEALDTDSNAELSEKEWSEASAALKKLDRNGDGELTADELEPNFGPGAGFGGPQRGGGRGDFGGRGGGRGFGGRGNPGDGGSQQRVEPEDIQPQDGVASIPDHETFQELSYKGQEVMIDTFLAGLEFVKFTYDQAGTDNQRFYFINTNTHRAHMMFARVAGLPFGRGGDQMKGVLVYRPMLKAPDGTSGLYTFEFEPFDAYPFEMVKLAHDQLVEKMPALKGRIGYFPRGERADAVTESEKGLYAKAGLPIYRDEDLLSRDIAYLPLNPGTGFGRLRVMDLDDYPSPRDVVLYRSLPNEMPRVAGIITEVRQTPLSHVNLRAIQDKVPNAFIEGASSNAQIEALVDKFVHYSVTPDGYRIREASEKEVQQHFANIRPTKQQVPPRDLSVRKLRSLAEVTFDDSASVGVKAANLATLHTFGFPEGTVPEGYTIPFSFYDDFMKYNGFYDYARMLLQNPEFRRSRQTQESELEKLRSLIKKGKMSESMMRTLDALHKAFPAGTSIRCRSSTNNEDLPGFSGAGLYDSFTHHPDEGHFSKSVKQVFASLWNFRAFDEREFYRVDHFSAAMGVLVHPNYSDEIANGVAVTADILYQTDGNYYVNTQIGEDLVTNPEEESIPEEILLDWWDSKNAQVMRRSNRSLGQLLSNEQLEQLRHHLGVIHGKFARLYGRNLEDDRFAMEIEFKVTRDGKLAIKQARPWVFAN